VIIIKTKVRFPHAFALIVHYEGFSRNALCAHRLGICFSCWV